MTSPPVAPSEAAALPDPRDLYTVSRLVFELRHMLEDGLPLLWVEGELSSLAAPRSGHLYFTLKDAVAQVRCVMFRSRARLLDFDPVPGDQVLLRGRATVYEARGDLQLQVESMEPAGEGALLRALEQLRRRLAAEGLFDAARKRPLPRWPRRIVLVTSPTGAAVRDVLSALQRRWPLVEVCLLGVPVQGADAPPQIAAAIRRADREQLGDVLILTRGGGSLEDLWAFNDEQVVRALADCGLPTVCGVGHEVDTSLADHAADLRAATPTAAAELATPDGAQILAQHRAIEAALVRAQQRRLQALAQRLDGLERRLQHPSARLRQMRERLERALAALHRVMRLRVVVAAQRQRELEHRLRRCSPAVALQARRQRLQRTQAALGGAMAQACDRPAQRLGLLAARMQALSPLATLGRGYALVQSEDGTLLRRAADVQPGAGVQVRLAEGGLDCRVEQVHPGPEAPGPAERSGR